MIGKTRWEAVQQFRLGSTAPHQIRQAGEQLYKEHTELYEFLSETYRRIPERQLGRMVCVQYDPAGSEYEFTEYEWSKRVREILGIDIEPQGF